MGQRPARRKRSAADAGCRNPALSSGARLMRWPPQNGTSFDLLPPFARGGLFMTKTTNCSVKQTCRWHVFSEERRDGAPFRGSSSQQRFARNAGKSFCPCQKTGGNSGFSPVFFLHVLYGSGVHVGSDFWFTYPSTPAAPLSSTQNAPGFAFFWLFRVRFPLFCCFPAAKFLSWFLCILSHSGYKLKPSVMPCRREVSFFT